MTTAAEDLAIRAVGAEQAVDLAAGDLEVEAVDRGDVAEGSAQPAGRDGRLITLKRRAASLQ